MPSLDWPTLIDDWYLTLIFLISLAIQGTAFIISFTLQFDKITDVSAAFNFFLNALLTILLHYTWNPPTFYARNVIVSIFQILWAVRLGSFLLYRVLKAGSDSRFDEMRGKILSFAGFWTFQLFWVFIVGLPVNLINSPNVSARGGNPKFGSAADVLGIIFWVFGFSLEALGDIQKNQYKSRKPAKSEMVGVWGYTRHPNYAGEILLWWGMWLLTIQPALSNAVPSNAKSALYAGVLSPLFTTILLLFVSGMPTAEKPVQKKYYLMQHGPDKDIYTDAWDRYQEYLRSTSILIPIPPRLYRPIPVAIKKTILLDWPMFQFNVEKEGGKAIQEAA